MNTIYRLRLIFVTRAVCERFRGGPLPTPDDLAAYGFTQADRLAALRWAGDHRAQALRVGLDGLVAVGCRCGRAARSQLAGACQQATPGLRALAASVRRTGPPRAGAALL